MDQNNERRRSTSESGRDRNRSGSRSTRSSSSRLAIILGIALAIETILLIASLIRTSVAEQENAALELVERQSATELDTLKPLVHKLRLELAQVKESRLPDLQRLEFGKVINIGKNYVKNVVFTAGVRNGRKLYEYKLVLNNSGMNLVHPQADILLFDQSGTQVGQTRIGVQKDGTTPTLDMLDRGETRSVSSQFETSGTAQPAYFRLVIQP